MTDQQPARAETAEGRAAAREEARRAAGAPTPPGAPSVVDAFLADRHPATEQPAVRAACPVCNQPIGGEHGTPAMAHACDYPGCAFGPGHTVNYHLVDGRRIARNQPTEAFTIDPSDGAEHAWDLAEAIRLTVEYLGTDILPAREGWSWFDALRRYAPAVAQRFVDQPVPMGSPLPRLSVDQTEVLENALRVLRDVWLQQGRANEAAARYAEVNRRDSAAATMHTRAATAARASADQVTALAELLGLDITGAGPDELVR